MKRGAYSTQKRKRLATDETYLNLKKIKTECDDTKENQKQVKVLLKQLRGNYGTKWVRKNVLPSLTGGSCKPFQQQVVQAGEEKASAPKRKAPNTDDIPSKDIKKPKTNKEVEELLKGNLPYGRTLADIVINSRDPNNRHLNLLLQTISGLITYKVQPLLEAYILGSVGGKFLRIVRGLRGDFPELVDVMDEYITGLLQARDLPVPTTTEGVVTRAVQSSLRTTLAALPEEAANQLLSLTHFLRQTGIQLQERAGAFLTKQLAKLDSVVLEANERAINAAVNVADKAGGGIASLRDLLDSVFNGGRSVRDILSSLREDLQEYANDVLDEYFPGRNPEVAEVEIPLIRQGDFIEVDVDSWAEVLQQQADKEFLTEELSLASSKTAFRRQTGYRGPLGTGKNRTYPNADGWEVTEAEAKAEAEARVARAEAKAKAQAEAEAKAEAKAKAQAQAKAEAKAKAEAEAQAKAEAEAEAQAEAAEAAEAAEGAEVADVADAVEVTGNRFFNDVNAEGVNDPELEGGELDEFVEATEEPEPESAVDVADVADEADAAYGEVPQIMEAEDVNPWGSGSYQDPTAETAPEPVPQEPVPPEPVPSEPVPPETAAVPEPVPEPVPPETAAVPEPVPEPVPPETAVAPETAAETEAAGSTLVQESETLASNAVETAEATLMDSAAANTYAGVGMEAATEEGLLAATEAGNILAGSAAATGLRLLLKGAGTLLTWLNRAFMAASTVQIGFQIAGAVVEATELADYRNKYPQEEYEMPGMSIIDKWFAKVTNQHPFIKNTDYDAEADPDKSRNYDHLRTKSDAQRDEAFRFFLDHPDGREEPFLGVRSSVGDLDIDWIGEHANEKWFMGRQEAQYRVAKYKRAKESYEATHGADTFDNMVQFSDVMRNTGYGLSTSDLIQVYNAANPSSPILSTDMSEGEMMRLTDFKTHMMSKALLHYPDLNPANYKASKTDLTEADIALAKTTLKKVVKSEESERAHLDWLRIFQHEPDETPEEAMKNNILRTKWEGIYPFGLEGGRYTTIDSAFDDWMPNHISNLLGFSHAGWPSFQSTYTYMDPSTGKRVTVSPKDGKWPPITLGDGRAMVVTMIKDDDTSQEKPVYTLQHPPRSEGAPEDTKDTTDSKNRAKAYHDMAVKKHVRHEYDLHLSNEDYDNDKCRVMFIYASAATDDMHNFRRIVQQNHEIFFYVLNGQSGSCDMLVCKEMDYLVIAFGEASALNTYQAGNAGLNHVMTEAFQGIREQALRRVLALYQQMHGLTEVYVTGIGTGGGVATLFAQEIAGTYQITVQSVITFNTPAWFSTSYRQSLNNFNIYEVRAKKNTAILSGNHQQVTPSKVYYLDEAGLEKTVQGDLRVHLGPVNPFYTTRSYFWDLLTSNKTDFDHMGKKYGAMNPMRRHWDLMLDNDVVKTSLTLKDVNLSNMYFTNSIENTQNNIRHKYSKTSIDSKYLI